ncbi:MAG: NACHT domain-containing protein [Pseudonocardiaceae bacterium]
MAFAVKSLWENEAELRRLNDPHPLPVSWAAADPDLVEDWSYLSATARSRSGMPPSNPSGWVDQPSGLCGSNGELGDVLSHRVPTGRLVVLGEPGSGKSMLLVRLVLDLLDRRDPGGPVPVLVPLASWNPHGQDLHTWLAGKLTTDHPGLREPAPATVGTMNRVQALLDRRLLLSILDGLDEMPGTVRGAAIAKINEALRPGERLVLSSRVAEYSEAVAPEGQPQVKLRGAAGVTLRELDPKAVEIYLLRDAGGGAWAARWDPVVKVLGTTAPVARALRTPLMVGLARTIYNPRPGEQTGSLPHPADLCDTNRFGTAAAVKEYLFEAFVPAAYRRHPDPAKVCPWSSDDAKRWLVGLARHLENHQQGKADLAWWELCHAAPRYLSGLVVGVATGFAAALASWVGTDIGAGIGVGLGFGLLLGLAVSLPVRSITSFATGPVLGLVGGLIGGLLGGFVAGLASLVGIGDASGLVGPLPIGLGVGMGIGPASGLVGGLAGGLAGGFGGGLVGALGVGLVAGLLNGLGVGLTAGLSVELIGRRQPASDVRWSRAGLAGGFAVAGAVGAAAWFIVGPMVGIAILLIGGILDALAVGLTAAGADLKKAAGPRAVLARDRRVFRIFGIVVAVATGPIAGIAVALVAVTESEVEPSLAVLLAQGTGVALTTALILGLTIAFAQAAWGSYTLARCWLAWRRRLPWRLTRFLADAHEQRGVLRQVGAVYQFRHIELQRHLAAEISSVPTDNLGQPH